MSETPKENSPKAKQSENVPAITYVGNPVNTQATKQKNPKRVAAGKRVAELRKGKEKLLKKGKDNDNNKENYECERSAIGVTFIAGIFGIVTGAIVIYKWLFSKECSEQSSEKRTQPVQSEPKPNTEQMHPGIKVTCIK